MRMSLTVAAESLSLLGPRAKDAVPALAAAMTRKLPDALGFDNYNPHLSAARALRRIGPAAQSAIPALIAALKPDESGYPEAAADVLGSFGPGAKAAIPALMELLGLPDEDDDRGTIRLAVAKALGRIGPDARVAVPLLRELAREKNFWAKEGAFMALCQLDPDGKALVQ